MPNIKSAIKRVSVIEKKTLRNNMIKFQITLIICLKNDIVYEVM